MSGEPRRRAPSERIRVWVKPGSRGAVGVDEGPDGLLVVKVAERAIDGVANAAALKALAAHLGVPGDAVEITAGRRSRIKTVTITRR